MNIYSHVTPTMQKSAIDRLGAYLGERPAETWHMFRHLSRSQPSA